MTLQEVINYITIFTGIFVGAGVIRTFIESRNISIVNQSSTIADMSYKLLTGKEKELARTEEKLKESNTRIETLETQVTTLIKDRSTYEERINGLETHLSVHIKQIQDLEKMVKEVLKRENYLLHILGLTNEEIIKYQSGSIEAEMAAKIALERSRDVH